MTGVLGRAATRLPIDPGVEAMIPSGPGDLDALRALQERFGSDEVALLALHGDRLFTRDGLERLDRLTRQVGALPHVVRVLSPTNARDLEGDELGPVPVVLYAEVQAGRLAPEALGARLAAHPIFGGLLVARDTRTAAILVEVEPATGRSEARQPLVVALRRLADGAGPTLAGYVAGIPVEKADVAAFIARDQRIFTPIVFLILAVATGALYRHPLGLLVPLGVVALALVWTLGLYGLSGHALNPVTSLMAPVILVMSLEGTVQLFNQYLGARARGRTRPAALADAHRLMWRPCLTAAATAAIGFLSLLALPIPAIRDFGLFTSLGIMLGYGLTMTLTPLLVTAAPDIPTRVVAAFAHGPVERGLTRLVRGVCAHPGAVALAAVALLLAAGAGIARLRVETDLIHALRRASPLAAATRFIDANLTGVNSVEMLVSSPSPDDLDTLARLARLEDAVRALPGVRAVTGLPDLLARINRAVHKGDDAYGRLPDGPDAATDVADFLAALGKEAPADLRRFLASGPRGQATFRVTARVTALSSAASQLLIARIREAAQAVGLHGLTLTGNFVVLSNMSTTLVHHQLRGLGVALVLIFAVMTLQFRSIRLGVLCAIPNGVPVFLVYGLMGWTGIALSVPTAMIASVAIGTIVDNSIYLLARLREGLVRRVGYVEALTAMVDAAGRAVVFSTVALVAGFWVGVLSSFLPTVHFGLLTGFAFLLGLVAQFVLLPLCLTLVQPLGGIRARAARRLGALIATTVIAGSNLATPARAQVSGSDVLLKDQFGKTDGPGRHRGQGVLLLYGKVDGLRRMKAWEERLRGPGFGPLVVLRGLDARSARGKRTEVEVNERLRLNIPPEIAILVDWNGDLATAFRLPDVDVSVTILDRTGTVCRTVAGPVTPEAADPVRRTLAHVREHGTCP